LFENLVLGVGLTIMGIAMVFVGNYFSKKIGIVHVVIYFMASFVILAGVLLLLVWDRPSIFF